MDELAAVQTVFTIVFPKFISRIRSFARRSHIQWSWRISSVQLPDNVGCWDRSSTGSHRWEYPPTVKGVSIRMQASLLMISDSSTSATYDVCEKKEPVAHALRNTSYEVERIPTANERANEERREGCAAPARCRQMTPPRRPSTVRLQQPTGSRQCPRQNFVLMHNVGLLYAMPCLRFVPGCLVFVAGGKRPNRFSMEMTEIDI
ncbi:hypothetical protein BJ912DRAFT_931016 [Pholiota molesta]|nr:hypothetical protein BJ912DRAFT_931016 [Pholiota molesta]